MARFTSTYKINSRWRNNDFVGDPGSSHTFADPLYDEFLVDWAPQIANGAIVITETPTTGNIQVSSLTVGNIVLTGTATGDFGAGGGGTIIGTSPISVATAAGTSTISLNANYQTAGTYVTAVSGTAPITSSGTTAITVGIDQTAITAAAATSALNTRTLVRNTTASTIAKGSVVYLSSSNGTVPTVEKALATSDATSSRTFGIVQADIGANSNGYVINQGVIDPIDTSGIADGSVLWLSTTVAGGYSTVKPVGPNHGVLVGVVVKGNSVGNGSIYIFIKNGAELDEIHDVNVSGMTDGQALVWSSASSVWINQSINTAIASVTGTTPVTATTDSAKAVTVAVSTGTTSATVALGNHLHTGTYQPAGTYVTSVTGDAAVSASGTTAVTLAHTGTDGYHHVPATSTTNSGKFLKAGATAGSEAWTNITTSDVTTGNYVATLAAGTGVTVTGADANAAAKTVSIGQAVATDSSPTFSNLNLTDYVKLSSWNYATAGNTAGADTTTITTATTYVALAGTATPEVSITPDFVGQQFMFTFTGYASLNTTVIQYAFIRCSITNSANAIITTPTDYTSFGFSRADNFGTSGRGATVTITKIWTADTTATRKFKLYGTCQTTSGLVLSLAYWQLSAVALA